MTMEDEKEEAWKTIEGRRNVLLTKSDWTQLPDAGLSRRCVIEWRAWRKELRGVRGDSYENRIAATTEIRRLRDNRPVVEYSSDEPIRLGEEEATVSRLDLTSIIRAVMEDINTASKPPQKPSGVALLDSVTDMAVARQIARKLTRERYNSTLEASSPTSSVLAMYNERLSQAIDLLSDTSDIVPLLDVMASVLEKTSQEVAESVIDKHRQMINDFCFVEAGYLRTLKKIQNSDTIGNLKEIVTEYGH